MQSLTLFNMTLFDRLKVGMFGCQNDTTTNFQQRQTLTMNLSMYNLSFHVNTLTIPRIGLRFISSETDANLDFHESLSTAFFLTLFGKNLENFKFFKISKPPFNLCTVTWISYHHCE